MTRRTPADRWYGYCEGHGKPYAVWRLAPQFWLAAVEGGPYAVFKNRRNARAFVARQLGGRP